MLLALPPTPPHLAYTDIHAHTHLALDTKLRRPLYISPCHQVRLPSPHLCRTPPSGQGRLSHEHPSCARASPALLRLYSRLPLPYLSCVDFSQSSVVQGTETHSSWFRNDVWKGAGGWAMDSQEEIEILGHSQDSQRGGTWNRERGSYSFWGWKPRISLGVSGLLCMPAPSSSFC